MEASYQEVTMPNEVTGAPMKVVNRVVDFLGIIFG
jgi:hypothetical protein